MLDATVMHKIAMNIKYTQTSNTGFVSRTSITKIGIAINPNNAENKYRTLLNIVI